MIELVCEGGDSKWLGEATRASREQLKTRGFHHDELQRFIIVCASCATKLSVLRLIGEERSETLSWASRRFKKRFNATCPVRARKLKGGDLPGQTRSTIVKDEYGNTARTKPPKLYPRVVSIVI